MRTSTLLLGSILALTALPSPAAPPSSDLDLAFVLDTTGSMSREIREAKDTIRQVAQALAASRPGARVRTGVVAYRDRGDAYLTRVSDLTPDVEATFTFLAELRAEGGGDGPEDVLAGLEAALALSWDPSPGVDRQVFLVGDAPPHLDYADGPRPEELLARARERRIVVHSIGCRSLPPEGVAFFRTAAYATEGAYQHIGRVDLGAVRTGAGGHGLAEAVLEAAGAEAGPDPGEPLTVRPGEAAAPSGAPGLLVEPIADRAGRTCGLGVSLPAGHQLARPPWVARTARGLRVRLALVSGQGGERPVFDLAPCVPATTPIHVELEE